MVEIVQYIPELEQVWDTFLESAKNGHFMFSRRYLEYHSDCFQDNSLLFYYKEKLVALLPAHRKENQLVSHAGLTFGGIITNKEMSLSLMWKVFEGIRVFMLENRLNVLYYRPIPPLYHSAPAQEDLAVLFQLGAVLVARDVISVVFLKVEELLYDKTVRWGTNRAKRMGMHIKRAYNFTKFMEILVNLLQNKYQTLPVHTTDEMSWLASLFPNNIELYEVYLDDELVGGMILYVTDQVVHAQYTAITESGKRNRALPYLVDKIIRQFRSEKLFFSLGTSKGGTYVNESLYRFKESVGARAMIQEQYEWRVSE